MEITKEGRTGAAFKPYEREISGECTQGDAYMQRSATTEEDD